MERKDNNLIIKGMLEIDGLEIPDIEGGFGKNKKSMLAKDIAKFHSKNKKHVNEAINKNRKHFKDNVDIIDIQGTSFVVDLVDQEILSQNSVNRSKNIYLISERGYSKLLKIFNDNLSWQMYDKLLDNYFQMRVEKEMDISGELDILQNMIILMKKQQDKVNYNSKKIEAIEGKVTDITEKSVPKNYTSFAGLAKKLNLYSTNDRLHSHLVAAICRKAGLKIDEDAPYQDEHIKIVYGNHKISSRTYLSPDAVDKLIKWWSRKESEFKYIDYYINPSKYGQPGDVKEIGYRLGKRTFRTFKASKVS